MIKVCKFGGTSMADGTTMLRVRDIVRSDAARRFIVVSAPGKRYSGDNKITDLLYETARDVEKTGHVGEAFEKVCARFCSTVRELGLGFPIEEVLSATREEIEQNKSEDFTASRGEYLAARVTAAMLGAAFVDARDTIKFDENGKLDAEKTYSLLKDALLSHDRAVLAGFYGSMPNGEIRTFSRGGSDISGAIAARAVLADVYENWTDVSGFLACDPRIVPSPAGIRTLSYKELRELSYMGANVLHSESIFPVREANIPIHIKNTFRPEDEGTEIVPPEQYRFGGNVVTGIAGKKNFTVIFLEKSLMNSEVGFAYRALACFMKYGVNFEHIPSGIDTMSFVIDGEELKEGVLDRLVEDIRAAVSPDSIRVFDDVALLAVVGHGMTKSVGTSARLFDAIANAGVNVRMIDQGSSELNIIVGVDNGSYERTVRAVYEEFFKHH